MAEHSAAGHSAAGISAGPGYPICASWKHHRRMAARISRGIAAYLSGHANNVAIEVHDAHLGVGCWYHAKQHFYSASAVKATILAALLRKAQEQHRALTASEKRLAWLMITQSNNSAAYTLFNDVGMPAMRHFLDLASMRETVPSANWGITQITAHDETLLLRLLMSPGKVLTNKSRRYELNLMGHVEPSERWGVRAGAPKNFSWHIKNGWSPLNTPYWWVNSIGCFLYKDRGYTIVVLTSGNATATAGITLIERFAKVINAGLNPGAKAVVPPSTPDPSWNIPDGSPGSAVSG